MAVKIMTSKRVFRSGGRGCRSRRHRTRGRVLLAKYRRRRRHVRLLRVSLRAREKTARLFYESIRGIDYSSHFIFFLAAPFASLQLAATLRDYEIPLTLSGGGGGAP